MDLRWNFKRDNLDRPQLPPPSAPVKPSQWFSWTKEAKEAPCPRMLYAKLIFTKKPFADDKLQQRCVFSFRIADTIEVFRPDSINNIYFVQEGTRARKGIVAYSKQIELPLHFRLIVTASPNNEYVYTDVLRIGLMESSAFRVELSNENHWMYTSGTDTASICEAIAEMFTRYHRVYKFLFGTEQAG